MLPVGIGRTEQRRRVRLVLRARTHLLGELARLVRRVGDLVVEHREVERQTQADGVCGGHLGLADIKRRLHGRERGDAM